MAKFGDNDFEFHVGSPPRSPVKINEFLIAGELLRGPDNQFLLESTNESERENFNRARAEQIWPAGSSINSAQSLSGVSEEDQEEMIKYIPREPRPCSVRPPELLNHASKFIIKAKVLNEPWVQDMFIHFQRWYHNSALDFTSTHTFEEVDRMMKLSIAFRNHKMVENGFGKEKVAIMSVWVVRHRVLIIEASGNNVRQKNALKSFPNDVMGKWCQPFGDLVVLPGVHKDIRILEDVFYEMQIAMRCIRKLKGSPLNRLFTTQMPRSNITASMPIVDPSFTAPLPSFTLLFRPIFTNFNVNMFDAAARLSAEMWQSGFLVFLKLADWALSINELGDALVFVQKMQRSVVWFTTLMPSKQEIADFYMFTMCHWVTGRCYFSLYHYFKKIKAYRQCYGQLQKKLEVFSREFFDSIATPTCVLFAYDAPLEFPKSAYTCIKMADWAYSQIVIPKGWIRSAHEQEMSQCIRILNDLCKWTEDIANPREPKRSLSERKHFLVEIEGRLCELLTSESCNNKVLANCLLAKSCRLHIVIKASEVMNHIYLKPHVLKLFDIAQQQIKLRSYVQWKALAILNEEYAKSRMSRTLRVLLPLIVRTAFDETIFAIEDQEFDPDTTRNIDRLFSCLPVLVDMWFRPRPQQDPTVEWIPQVNSKTFNVAKTMFFFGLASCYNIMRSRGSRDKEVLESNVTYCFALFALFLRRKGSVPALMKALLDYVLLMERCCLCFDSTVPSPTHKAERGLLVLRRMVYLLPILHEFTIINRDDASPEKFNGVHLDLDDLKSTSVLSYHYPESAQNEKDIVVRAVDHMKREIKICASWEYPLLPGRADKGVEITTKCPQFRPLPDERNMSVDSISLNKRSNREKRNPLLGRDFCAYKNCPIEQYHEEEEQNFRLPWKYPEDTFRKVFKDLDDTDDREESFPQLIKKLLDVLARVIEVAKIGLCDIIKDHKYNSQLESEVDRLDAGVKMRNKQFHTPKYLISELRILSFNLRSDKRPEQNIVEILFKLDRLLNNSEVTALLRSTVEI